MVGHIAGVVLVSANEGQAMNNAHTHIHTQYVKVLHTGLSGLSWGYVSMGDVFSYAGMNVMAFL